MQHHLAPVASVSLSVKGGVADHLNSDKSDVEGTPATTVCSGQSARIDALLAAIATAQMENGRLSAEVVAQQKDIEGLRQYRVNVKAKDARIEHLEASEAGLKAALAFLKGQETHVQTLLAASEKRVQEHKETMLTLAATVRSEQEAEVAALKRKIFEMEAEARALRKQALAEQKAARDLRAERESAGRAIVLQRSMDEGRQRTVEARHREEREQLLRKIRKLEDEKQALLGAGEAGVLVSQNADLKKRLEDLRQGADQPPLHPPAVYEGLLAMVRSMHMLGRPPRSLPDPGADPEGHAHATHEASPAAFHQRVRDLVALCSRGVGRKEIEMRQLEVWRMLHGVYHRAVSALESEAGAQADCTVVQRTQKRGRV